MSKKSKRMEQLTVFGRSLVVGGAAGALSKTVVAPIERIKIVLQTEEKGQFNGIIDCAKQLWTRQPKSRSVFVKPITYWRGNVTNVMRYFPMQAINFACKDRYKRIFMPRRDYGFWEEMFRTCLAGGFAGATGLIVVYPMDFARTRLTADIGAKRQYNGLFDVLKHVYKYEGGFLGMYKGFAVSVAGIIPYRAAYFGGYDIAKKHLMHDKPENYSFFTKWAISQTTSVFSQFVAYPFDTVRRRMQLMGQGGVKYNGSIDCFTQILKKEGFGALYKGALANAVRATGCALCLVFYEEIGGFLFPGKDYGTH